MASLGPNELNHSLLKALFCILIIISLEFVPLGPIDNKSGSGLVQRKAHAITCVNADPIYGIFKFTGTFGEI